MPILSLICPDNGIEPLESKVTRATELQTALINSKLRLFKSGTLIDTSMTTKAMLEAIECDYDGYVAGGLTIAAFGDPLA